MNLAVVILAAGKGKRMNNPDLPKVLVELVGKPLLGHVLEQAKTLDPEEFVIVVGHHMEKVIQYVDTLGLKKVKFVEQKDQLGTGHAVAQAESALEGFDGNVLILCGDVPLLQAITLDYFIEEHTESEADVSVLSTLITNPKGYGRIVRDNDGHFIRIVEEKDASEEEKLINEINSGVYIIRSGLLFSSLKQVSNDNAQEEYYLTDIIDILRNSGHKVNAIPGVNYQELQGVNSPEDLKTAERFYHLIQKS